MHNKEQDLQRYVDGELTPAESIRVEKHLAECTSCQTRLDELNALTSMLQSWTLPTGLTRLKQSVTLPAQPATTQIKLGVIGWVSGIVLVLLFIMVRAIFLLSGQLNWVVYIAVITGFSSKADQLTFSLGEMFRIHPFFLTLLGEPGEGVGLMMALMVPVLLYVICVGGLIVLYLNWFNLTFGRQPKKI